MARRVEIMLDRHAVLVAAFEVLEDGGLDAVTMSAVARRLSVHPPALYWHVRDKADLIRGMAADMLQEGRAGLDGCATHRDWLEAYARRFVHILLSRRDGARLFALAQPVAIDDPAEQSRIIVGPLTARGMSEEAAHAAIASIMAFTLGWASHLSNAPMAKMLGALMNVEATFDQGLAALITGFRLDA